jgi:uncharacterized membrane protein
LSALLNALPTEPAGFPDRPSRRSFLIGALLLLTLGVGLRIYHLGVRSLWLDEALTANISRGIWYDDSFTGHPSHPSLTEVLQQTRKWGSSPALYPWILLLVEKVSDGPTAVRMPSVIASILAVLMMLAMAWVNVSPNAALFSAAILAISTTQIRYAQEVREYSLSVLFASILVFCLLRWEATGTRSGHPVLLYAALFCAPFIQYGLVLFALGVLATIGLQLLLARDTRFRLSHGVIACASLGTGGLFSLLLTLRYQLGIRQYQWYLADNYFDWKSMSVLRFAIKNSHELLGVLFGGRAILICFAIAATIFCIAQARRRKFHPVVILAFASVLVNIGASLAGLYPYGGIRQCLFLAPVWALFAGIAFSDLVERLSGNYRKATVLVLMVLILVSGSRGILKASPYQEFQDVRRVLNTLSQSSAPTDQIYVHHGAAPAVAFYWRENDARLIYGKDHTDAPQQYAPELLAAIHGTTDRIWLVFTNIHGSEEQDILDSLRPGWNVQCVVAATRATLYVARRASSSAPGSAQR